jgi:hypothetical protein
MEYAKVIKTMLILDDVRCQERNIKNKRIKVGMSMVVASVIADDKTKFDEYSPHP